MFVSTFSLQNTMPYHHIEYYQSLFADSPILCTNASSEPDHQHAFTADINFCRQHLFNIIHHNPPQTNNTSHDPATPITAMLQQISALIHHHKSKKLIIQHSPLLNPNGSHLPYSNIHTLSVTHPHNPLTHHLQSLFTDSPTLERVHLIPQAQHSLRDELLSLEGVGTMITKTPIKEYITTHTPSTEHQMQIIRHLLELCSDGTNLATRDMDYLRHHAQQMRYITFDGLPAASYEIIPLSSDNKPPIYEIGAIAAIDRFRSMGIGSNILDAFLSHLSEHQAIGIAVTKEPAVQHLLAKHHFAPFNPTQHQSPPLLIRHHQAQHKHKQLYINTQHI